MKVAETVDSRLYFAVGNDLLPCALATCIQPAGKFLLLCRCIILFLREVIIFVEQNHNKLMGSADHVTSCGFFVFFSSVFGAKKNQVSFVFVRNILGKRTVQGKSLGSNKIQETSLTPSSPLLSATH